MIQSSQEILKQLDSESFKNVPVILKESLKQLASENIETNQRLLNQITQFEKFVQDSERLVIQNFNNNTSFEQSIKGQCQQLQKQQNLIEQSIEKLRKYQHQEFGNLTQRFENYLHETIIKNNENSVEFENLSENIQQLKKSLGKQIDLLSQKKLEAGDLKAQLKFYLLDDVELVKIMKKQLNLEGRFSFVLEEQKKQQQVWSKNWQEEKEIIEKNLEKRIEKHSESQKEFIQLFLKEQISLTKSNWNQGGQEHQKKQQKFEEEVKKQIQQKLDEFGSRIKFLEKGNVNSQINWQNLSEDLKAIQQKQFNPPNSQNSQNFQGGQALWEKIQFELDSLKQNFEVKETKWQEKYEKRILECENKLHSVMLNSKKSFHQSSQENQRKSVVVYNSNNKIMVNEESIQQLQFLDSKSIQENQQDSYFIPNSSESPKYSLIQNKNILKINNKNKIEKKNQNTNKSQKQLTEHAFSDNEDDYMKSLNLKKQTKPKNSQKPLYKDFSKLENLKTAPDFSNELINNNVNDNLQQQSLNKHNNNQNNEYNKLATRQSYSRALQRHKINKVNLSQQEISLNVKGHACSKTLNQFLSQTINFTDTFQSNNNNSNNYNASRYSKKIHLRQISNTVQTNKSKENETPFQIQILHYDNSQNDFIN